MGSSINYASNIPRGGQVGTQERCTKGQRLGREAEHQLHNIATICGSLVFNVLNVNL